jgi:hypothetical protein
MARADVSRLGRTVGGVSEAGRAGRIAPALGRSAPGDARRGRTGLGDRCGSGNDRRVPLEGWERLDTDGDCSVALSTLASIPGQDWPPPPLLLAIRELGGLITEARSDSVVQTTVRSSEQRVSRALFRGLVVDAAIVSTAFLLVLLFPPRISVGFQGRGEQPPLIPLADPDAFVQADPRSCPLYPRTRSVVAAGSGRSVFGD